MTIEVPKSFPKLRGKIVEVYGSQKAFASAISRSEQNVNAKLAGRSQFDQQDIAIWSNALGISTEEIGTYFFA